MDLQSETSTYGNVGIKQEQPLSDVEVKQICQWIVDLRNMNKRENALLELSKNREKVPELAVWIWQSYGTMNCILQEIFSAYSFLNDPSSTTKISNRVCNALTLLQTVASHPNTRQLFLQSHSPVYLYPFLNTDLDTKAYDCLQLTSLGVIGAMIRSEETEVVKFLLSTGIVSICLRIMSNGNELLRTVSMFILEKILMDEYGLEYTCGTYERFSHVAIVLEKVVDYLAIQLSPRLFKHVIRCYARLSENDRAVRALAQCLPEQLQKEKRFKFTKCDETTNFYWDQLLDNISVHMQNTI